MILNITFTHPEKIYKGNKTVTNSEGNVVRLSRQKWMNTCSRRNALQSSCWRAGGSPPGLGTTPLGCHFPWCPPPLFFQPDQNCLHGTAVLVSKSAKEAQDHYCVHTDLLIPAPLVCLELGGLLFSALGPSSVSWNYKKRVMIKSEDSYQIYQLPLTVTVPLIVKYYFIFCSFSHENWRLNVHFTSQCQKALRNKEPYYCLKNRWYNIISYFCAGRRASSTHLSLVSHLLHRHIEEGHRWHLWA